MNTAPQPDSLHRLVKHAIDSGRAESVAEAEAMFRGYRVAVEIGPAAAEDPVNQATLLTVVALARRVFLGGVSVSAPLGTVLSTPPPLGRTLAAAVKTLGAEIGVAAPGTPTIVIGGGPGGRRDGFSIRTAAAGWRGGVLPVHSSLGPVPGPAMPLAGMLSAALAVNEAYLYADGISIAGRRVLGLSLWQPDAHADWLAGDPEEPELTFLPSRLWLIGLGHLGQAYLWGLGILPYRHPADLSLVLQDVDIVTDSTESTSVLTRAEHVGQKKTRAMAAWADARGFETAILERLFDADFERQQSEPGVALCGLDNATYRRALDRVGFDMVIGAGLGNGYRDFRTMRLHTLPGPRPAAQIWSAAAKAETVEDRPAYQRLLREGTLDQCGMTMLAGKAVGAPFVGAVAATLVLSEILRHLHGGWVHQMIDVDLLGLDQRLAFRHEQGFDGFNPGFTEAEWPIPAANGCGSLAP
ncbi:MAG: thiamine biosynthesis protein ThiF [Gemmatimonadota bacterium]|nr:thiamine biosynthesis protein ThiF [Gemmatimonadota bacterium]